MKAMPLEHIADIRTKPLKLTDRRRGRRNTGPSARDRLRARSGLRPDVLDRLEQFLLALDVRDAEHVRAV